MSFSGRCNKSWDFLMSNNFSFIFFAPHGGGLFSERKNKSVVLDSPDIMYAEID